MSKWFLILMIALIGSISTKSFAEERYNQDGNIIISIDNLFGFSVSRESSSYQGIDTSSTDYNTSLFGSIGSTVVPRISKVGIDTFVGDEFSFGIGFMLADNCKGHSQSDTGYTNLALGLINPRIGYGMSFSDHVGLWSRAGFTYAEIFNSFLEEEQLWLGVNSNLVVNVKPGVSITGGLMFDSMVIETQMLNGKMRLNDSFIVSVGAQFGILAFF